MTLNNIHFSLLIKHFFSETFCFGSLLNSKSLLAVTNREPLRSPSCQLLFHQQRLDPTMSEPLLRQSDAEEDELIYDYRSSQISKEVICLCTNLHSCLVDSEFYM